MREFSVVVVGGGASGITAAISAARSGASVAVCEKTARVGRKILASGNGRCNLANDDLDASFYNPASRHLAQSVFSRFGIPEIKGLFASMGLVLRSDAGRVFPVTDQASSVLKALEMEASRLSVHVVTEFDALSIGRAKDAGRLAVVSRSGGSLFGRSVILACGGKSYPAFGSDGSAYRLAQKLGHSIVEPVPVAVPLVVKHRLCHTAQGQKIAATVRAFIGQAEAARAHGDVLFTKYGLSGTAILDVSEGLSIALNRDKRRDASVIVDMAPFIDKDSLAAELASRAGRKLPWGDLLVGILPNRLSAALADTLRAAGPAGAAEAVKNMRFEVTGTRGWNEADFTAGGVDVREVDSGTLESRKIAGVYFAGEMLDVNGARGGYNLAWAWASGFLAGKAAADA